MTLTEAYEKNNTSNEFEFTGNIRENCLFIFSYQSQSQSR